MTDLEKLCAYWQKRLRLQDWDVTVKPVRHHELDQYRHAEISICSERKTAVMSVVNLADRNAELAITIEESVIHELLHLHFDSFWNKGKSTEMEQAINLIAKAFVPLPEVPRTTKK